MKDNHEEEDQNSTLDLLLRFGLSKDEANTYILLSRANIRRLVWLKGNEISQLSKKSRVRAYQILQRLLELGLVRIDFSRPKRYSAVSPQAAVRRLLSLQESKITELSRLEANAIESLLDLEPLEVESVEVGEKSEEESSVSVLNGLANIQIALKEIMDVPHLSIVLNEESYEHVLSVMQFLTNRPGSSRIVLATPKRVSIKEYSAMFGEGNMTLVEYRGTMPAFLVSESHVVFLYYTIEKKKKRPLSSLVTSSTVSQIAIIRDPRYVQQLKALFSLIWSNSEEIVRRK